MISCSSSRPSSWLLVGGSLGGSLESAWAEEEDEVCMRESMAAAAAFPDAASLARSAILEAVDDMVIVVWCCVVNSSLLVLKESSNLNGQSAERLTYRFTASIVDAFTAAITTAVINKQSRSYSN